MDDALVRMSAFFGHCVIVETTRWEGDSLILGGYAIHYDEHGIETHRTPNTENVVVRF